MGNGSHAGIDNHTTGGKDQAGNLWSDNLDRTIRARTTGTSASGSEKVPVGGTTIIDQGTGGFQIHSSTTTTGSTRSSAIGSIGITTGNNSPVF